jgi:hypothetical protein
MLRSTTAAVDPDVAVDWKIALDSSIQSIFEDVPMNSDISSNDAVACGASAAMLQLCSSVALV